MNIVPADFEKLGRIVAESNDADAQQCWREIEHRIFMEIHFPADDYDSPRRQAMAIRDFHIQQAYALIDGARRRQRILSLIRKIKLFRSTTWTHVDRKRPPPDRLTPIQKQLFFAFQIAAEHGLTVPESRSMLYEIVFYETANEWTQGVI